MKIDSSTIRMDSGRSYTQSTGYTKTVDAQTTDGMNYYHSSTSFIHEVSMYTGSSQTNGAFPQYDTYTKGLPKYTEKNPMTSSLYTNSPGANIRLTDARTALEDFRRQFVKQLEEFMERIRAQLLGNTSSFRSQQNMTCEQITGSSTALSAEDLTIVDLTTKRQPGNLWKIQTASTMWYEESETTDFSTKGLVKTADGRNIEFDISLKMSRTFREECTQISEQTQYILTDPLVIKLNNAPETISDQTWLFDIDGDGVKDSIHELTNGNGFLAIDTNENGIIDDGTELFGTKSGNGFQDLAIYDEDGNGFIDENDIVYSKLKIWTKDASGNDTLMDLKQADIGAIYLGYANTDFSHNDLLSNETQAVVRNTGFYLHESTGTAGIMQQIDFVKQDVLANA